MFSPDDKILIAMAKGTSKNIKMVAGAMTFRDFGKFCSKPQQGGKHESYFTRGVPNIEEEYQSKSGREYYNGRFRHDGSISKGDFLIIDADNSVASPEDVHKILKDKEYAHFIYTSHSHSVDSNNFRVVLPCTISSKRYMVATAKGVIDIITGVEYVREMGVWSQAWYLPTRDDPDDGIFEFYEYYDGTEFLEVQEEQTVESSRESTGNLIEEVQSMAQMIQVITTGAEGMHHAMKSYSYGAVQDGQNKTVVKETLRGLMMACVNRDSRWQQRYDDIDRLVDGVEEQDSSELDMIDKEDDDKSMILEWPPGIMGELAQSVYAYSDYPNRVISCVTALGLVAGIAGRRFNVNGAGLNLYMTLLMNTGEGKSVIDSYIGRALNDAEIFSGAMSFVGKRRYTGPKALMDDLYNKRSMVSVFSEAGFMFNSKSGDQSGLTRTILDLYGKSGYGQVMQSEGYSDSKNSIPAVVSPCFSMVNESTPDIFLQALRGGTETGEITRMNIFRVEMESHKLNRKKDFHMTHELKQKIKHLMSRCNATQKQDDPDVTDFEVTEKMWEFNDLCKKSSMDKCEEEPIRSRMLGRAGLKAWKVASLCSIMNNHGEKGSRLLPIDEESWEWAKHLHDFEMFGLEDFFEVSGESDLYSLALDKVYKVIRRILVLGYSDRQAQPRKVDRDAKRMPVPMLRRKVGLISAVRCANGDYGKKGIDAMVDYLVKKKWISLKVIDVNGVPIEYAVVNDLYTGAYTSYHGINS